MVFNFIGTWGEYMWASIASSSSTKIQTIPVGLLYFRGEYGIEWGPFAAAITIIVVPLIAIFIYLQRYFIQGLTSGAVKADRPAGTNGRDGKTDTPGRHYFVGGLLCIWREEVIL